MIPVQIYAEQILGKNESDTKITFFLFSFCLFFAQQVHVYLI